MPIYRGAGGAGDATADGSSEALLIRELAIEVQADADAASDSATAAASSASGAATSATNASNSATAAATSATNASNSASAASTSATNAANSATAAQTAETAAELAETNAETAETNAETAATNAASSASAASTSATNASNSASAASTSATNASNSASAASTSASNASTSATAAASSASAASTSASNASTSATNAAASATSASGSATTATTQAGIATTKAGEAATSATNAASSATAASGSATTATTQATNASNSASAAATSATNASNSASSASTSATNAANSATAAAASAASINPASIAITGGSINGTTVGATTPSTGSFTSLTDSGNLTFTGTGNRILGDFSNGTLTSRVAFQTSTTNGNTKLMVIPNGTSVTTGLTAYNNSDILNASFFDLATTSNEIRFTSGINGTGTYQPLTMFTGGSERLRIDTSGNVGINTSSPAYPLDIVSNSSSAVGISLRGQATNIGLATFWSNDGVTRYSQIRSASDEFRIQAISSIPVTFYTANTERMRIDSSGNVGINYTAMSSLGAKLYVYGYSGFGASANGSVSLGSRTNWTSTFENNAGGYGLGVNVNSSTGIVNIQSQRFDGTATAYDIALNPLGGNVGIGTSTPAQKLQVVGTVSSIGGSVTANMSSDGSNGVYETNGACFLRSTTSNPVILGTNNTERMRIDSSGNLGIGSTSPTAKLQVTGTIHLTGAGSFPSTGVGLEIVPASAGGTNYIQAYNRTGASWQNLEISSAQTVFGTGGTERMRIDSSGALLVNRTANTATFSQAALSYNANAGNRGLGIQATVQDAGTAIQFLNASATVCGTISQSTSATAYNTSSDYRLKENIAPMTGALDVVSALKPVTYNWKVDGSTSQGFIAHELQEVVSECVTGEKDAVDDEGKPVYQGVDTSFLVATLTAAIQELKATVDAQAARIAALESN
jgi:hypothetical protein